MEIILKQDVDKLGHRGQVVKVSAGYGRNYLLPRGLAEVATPALQKEVAKRDAQRARHEAKTVDEARSIAERLEAKEMRFDVSAGPAGSLFGSVTATNVADRLWAEQKIRIDRRKLHLDTIKRVGRYTVPVDLFADVTAELRLVVAPEGQELPDEEALAAAAAAEAAAEAAAAEAASAAHAEAEAAVAEAEAEAEAPVVEDADETSEEEPAPPVDEADQPVETEQ